MIVAPTLPVSARLSDPRPCLGVIIISFAVDKIAKSPMNRKEALGKLERFTDFLSQHHQ